MIYRLFSHSGRLLRLAEVQAALLLGLIIYASVRCWSLFSLYEPRYQHLGAEYYNIAVALVEGRGFSDPFAEPSGSTAWMPPAYPVLLAALLTVLRTRVLVAEAVMYLSIVGLTTVGVIVFHIAKGCASRVSPWLSVAFYVAWLWLYYDWFFTLTHDIWLLTLLASLVLWSVFRCVWQGALSGWSWGILGGLVVLTSPSLAVAWLALTGAGYVRLREVRRKLLTAAAIAFCMAAPWVVRNAIQFHKLIPVKPNVYYEAYRANYADDDGIYDGDFRDHPFSSPEARFHYTQMGEVGFIEEHKAKFFAAVRAEPQRYFSNIVNRALAVTVHYVPNKGRQRVGFTRGLQASFYSLPFLGLLCAWATRGAARRLLAPIALLWAMYALPYVLVAFYLRYIMPLTSVLVLLIFIGVDQLAHAFAAIRRRVVTPWADSRQQ